METRREERSVRTGVLGALLLLVAAGAAAFAVVQVVQGVLPGAVHLAPSLVHPDRAVVDLPGLPADARAVAGDQVDLRLADPGGLLRLLLRLPDAVGALAVAAGSLLLRRLSGRIGRGRPFEPGTAATLTWLASLVLVVGVVVPVASDLVTLVVLDHAGLVRPGSPFVAGFSVSAIPFVLAFLVVCLADAWRRGTAMHEDLEGLV